MQVEPNYEVEAITWREYLQRATKYAEMRISKLRNIFDFDSSEKFNLDIVKIAIFENFFDFECSEGGEGVEDAS